MDMSKQQISLGYRNAVEAAVQIRSDSFVKQKTVAVERSTKN
jgi:hypothetical protein